MQGVQAVALYVELTVIFRRQQVTGPRIVAPIPECLSDSAAVLTGDEYAQGLLVDQVVDQTGDPPHTKAEALYEGCEYHT